MQDLRLVAANERGSHLVLRSAAGDRYLLPIDERLRAAARGDRARLGRLDPEAEGSLRPRDIQARIRAGATAEQIASEARVGVERVRRFEGPVLAERAHVATMAQKGAVRSLRLEGRAGTLAEALPARLGPLAIKDEDLEWDSWRRDDGRWIVDLAYHHDGDTQHARFLYDATARTVVPADDQARWLLSELEHPPVRGPFVPRLAELPAEATQPEADERGGADAGEVDAGEVEVAPAGAPIRRPDPTMDRRPPDVVARPVPFGPGAAEKSPRRNPLPAQPTLELPGRDIDLRDGERSSVPLGSPPRQPRRERRAVARRRAVDAPATPPVKAPEPVVEAAEEERKTGTTDARASVPRTAGGRSRRASVPSWDDILFGTRGRE